MLYGKTGTKGFTHREGIYTSAAYLGRFVLIPFNILYRYYQTATTSNGSDHFPYDLDKQSFSEWISNDVNRKSFFDYLFQLADPEGLKKEKPKENLIELNEEIAHHFSLHATKWWFLLEFIAYLKRAISATLCRSLAAVSRTSARLGGALIELSIVQHALINVLRPIVEGQMHYKEYRNDEAAKIERSYGSDTATICKRLYDVFSRLNEKDVRGVETIVEKIILHTLQNSDLKLIIKKLSKSPAHGVSGVVADCRAMLLRELEKKINEAEIKTDFEYLMAPKQKRISPNSIYYLIWRYIIQQPRLLMSLALQLTTSFEAWKRAERYFLGLLSFKKEAQAVYKYPGNRMYTLEGAHRSYDPLVAKIGDGEIGHSGFESVFKVIKNKGKYYEALTFMYYFVNIFTAGIVGENPRKDLEFARELNPKIGEYYDDLYVWTGKKMLLISLMCDQALFGQLEYEEIFPKIISIIDREITNVKESSNRKLKEAVEMFLETQFIHGG